MSAENILPSTTVSSTCSQSSDSESNPCGADSLNSLCKTVERDEADCMNVSIQCPIDSSKKSKRRDICCSPIAQCVWGVLLIILSSGSFIFTPQDFMLWEKLNMRPGLPPYEWWSDPPDEVVLRAYVFNVTNHDRFMAGLDPKLNVAEIGPIVYLEKLQHFNVTFNENSTLTYTAKRSLVYIPEQNDIDLNSTIIVPNIPVLGIYSYLHDASFFTRMLLNSMATLHGSQPFVRKTIYEYLWDFTDPLLDTSRNIAPGIVPVNNVGILDRIYSDFTDEMSVKIGPKWGHKQFFQIDRFRGQPVVPGFNPDECPDRILGSTEGVMYPQRLTKDDVLQYWRKTVCKVMPLYFDSELTISNVPLYRYNLSESVFDRVGNMTDCYDTTPSLLNGISDASKCYFNFPMVVSYPHFYTGGVPKDHYVTGLKPDRHKHNSYVELEPQTGTPFQAVARMQSNLRIYDISAFDNKFSKLSNLILPIFWGEYNQVGLPTKIRNTVFFMTVILPPLTTFMSITMLILGFYVIIKHIYRSSLSNNKLKPFLQFRSENVGKKNIILAFEKETFLKSS